MTEKDMVERQLVVDKSVPEHLWGLAVEAAHFAVANNTFVDDNTAEVAHGRHDGAVTCYAYISHRWRVKKNKASYRVSHLEVRP